MKAVTQPRRYSGPTRAGKIGLCWEVVGDPITDDYYFGEAGPHELWRLWRDRYPDPILPIHWFVRGPGDGVFEVAPFQTEEQNPIGEDFLTFFEWPETPDGRMIDWLAVPVEDKFWRPRRQDKGGFIQELTGWKPSPFQPSMPVAALEQIHAGQLATGAK